jgi:hypothetical protein
MASVRRLKKDIEYFSAQLIGDCLGYIQFYEEAKDEEALEIIKEAISLHNESIDKASHPDGKDNPQIIKAYYKKLKHDFVEGLDKAYENLEALVKE